jgi:hypothetical protein
VALTAEEDHRRTMALLKIDKLRRGADARPDSPYAANFDESKATPYPTLPDPLKLASGEAVTTPDMWWKQRRRRSASCSTARSTAAFRRSRGLGTSGFPPIETALIDGELAFRQHRGGHTTGPNWPTFVKFAERHVKPTK